MTFTELIEEVSRATGLSKPVVSLVLRTSYTEILKALRTDKKVVLKNFGIFYLAKLKERSLFGGTKMSEKRDKVRFKLSRRKEKSWKSTL